MPGPEAHRNDNLEFLARLIEREECSPEEARTLHALKTSLPPRRRILLWAGIGAIVLMGIGTYVVVRTHIPPFFHLEALWKSSPLTQLRPQEFEERVERDMSELAGLRDGLSIPVQLWRYPFRVRL